MSARQVLFHAAAREKALRGATALADAVRITLGPRSKCVLIQRKWGTPLVCDDGVTIAKELELADLEEDLGVRMLRQAAQRTSDAVGDGTTTSTLLAHAMFADGLKNVVAGASAIHLKRGLEGGLLVVIESLRAQSRPVRSRAEKEQVATISAHGNAAIGKMVADAMEKVGDDGVITVEEAKSTDTTLEVVEGMRFDRGYLSPYFVTNGERMECVLEDPSILLYDRKINAAKDLVPVLEAALGASRSLLVIADDVEAEALATLVVNNLRGTLRVCAVRAPEFGDRRKLMLQDIAVLTGGRVISEDTGTKLEHATLGDLGQASRITITKDTTTLVGGAGDRQALRERAANIRAEIERATSDYDREKLQQRVARLTGGVAVVRVGAPTEADMKSRKDAFDDAIHATQAAIAEGIVPGGGLALLRAVDALIQFEATVEGDERTGVRVLRRALEVPARQIAENAGMDAGVVVDRMRAGTGAFGFDAAKGTFGDLVEAGILDPTKVVRTAVESAVSVAGLLLLTEATMTELPSKEKEMPAMEGM